jgi:mannonate dehydratase
MFRVAVFTHHAELSDTFLQSMSAFGADALDFGGWDEMPGVKQNGIPDFDGVKALRRHLRSFGLEINRVTLPDLTESFLSGGAEGEAELARACEALRIYGEAKIPIARQRVAGDVYANFMTGYRARHRGGMTSRGESLGYTKSPSASLTKAQYDQWWERFTYAFERLVPIAEEFEIKLAIHPSDTPNVDTPFGGPNLHRVIDAFPSPQVGFVYCIGTRAEAGGSSLVIDEINQFGRKGKIFMCHMRNVRGSLATAGGYEETLLDDGDLNMFKFLMELKKVGFGGYINPDHIPTIPGDTPTKLAGWAYSIGYLKALFAAAVA